MRHAIQCLIVAFATSLPAVAAAQEQEEKPANPFEIKEEAGYGAMGGGYGEMGGGSPYGDGSPYGAGGSSPYGSGGAYPGAGGYGMSMASPPDPFRAGLARLLDMLPKAKSEEEKKQLLQYARDALTKRYQQQLDNREREIRNLELRLAALRDEQQRRSDAAERIIELQMKSLELAAEGLLERDQVIHLSPRDRIDRGGYGGGGGASPYGGGSPYGGSPMGAGSAMMGGAGGESDYGFGPEAGGYGEEGEAAPGGEPAADAEQE